ncbi:MAG TPA: GNAT family N-acetyltransferase [Pyrinomonadaceae bacterium]|jgi:ElaA protein
MTEQTDATSAMTATDQSTAQAVVWQWSAFDKLSLDELYTILRVRQMVFVVEQACPYLDADGYDERAWHLLGWVEQRGTKTLAAYARIFPPGIKYAEASIGRVVTHPSMRRKGMGEALMSEALRRIETLVPGADVRIGAQAYLERFYEKAGFRRVSEPYDEDGIIHIEMLRAATV